MKNAEIYCDESCPDFFTSSNRKGRFLLIGGVKILKDKREEIKNSLNGLKESSNINGEFKWQKVSTNKLDFYKAIVDIFFEFNNALRFKCIVVDADTVDFEKYHNDDKELGFYKFYFYMLKHWLKPDVSYRIFTDLKTNRIKHRLLHLHKCLAYANIDSTIESVQALPSKEVVLLQLSDFLLGMVSSKFNHSLQNSSAKNTILTYFEEKLGHEIMATSKDSKKYNIFKIDLERDQW